MEVENLAHVIEGHTLFKGLSKSFLDLVTGCAKNVRFEAGEYICREGDLANEIYLVRHGKVAMEISAPGRGSMTFLTAGPNEVVGLSWLVPPYRWTFDARAMDLVRAISLDATCLRNKCEQDHHLGYEVMKRFTPVLVERLHSTRLQVLDLYGQPR
jgi:CRP-like cAMP-binding protein